MPPVNVSIVGLGTVGSGVVRLLTQSADMLSRRLGAPLVLKKAAEIDAARASTGPGLTW